MEVAMLIIGLLIGGCISTALLCCVHITRVMNTKRPFKAF